MKNRVKIMGILNVTPNSFFDGGKFLCAGAAICGARKIIADGADIIDIGGESTGPGSSAVSIEEELRRVIPVIKAISSLCIVSTDTYKAEVARAAITAGALIINDVTALRGDTKMAKVIANSGVKIILMYSKDLNARTTRVKKNYRDVVFTVMKFLEERIDFALKNGIKREQIIIDPGMGAFISGNPKYSYEILRRLNEFKRLGFPILIGTSMKSFLPGQVSERSELTFISNSVAIKNGANIIRVHDVQMHKKLIK